MWACSLPPFQKRRRHRAQSLWFFFVFVFQRNVERERDPCFAFPSSAFPLPLSLPFLLCLETDFHMAQTNLLFATQQRVTLNSVFLPPHPHCWDYRGVPPFSALILAWGQQDWCFDFLSMVRSGSHKHECEIAEVCLGPCKKLRRSALIPSQNSL